MSINSQHVAPFKGIAFMVTSALFMNLNNAILKLLAEEMPPGEIMFLRSMMTLSLIIIYAGISRDWTILRVYSWTGHSIGAICLGCSAYCFILSIQFLPLGTTVALTFAAPLLITAMAGPILREKIGWQRWSAVGVGFLGVIIITRPGTDVFTLTALLPLACAFVSAIRDIINRHMTAGESSVSIMLTANIGMAGFGLFSVPFGWSIPDVRSILLLTVCVPLVIIGHYTMIDALRYAEAAVASPFRYTAIIWAGLLGYIIWDDVPDIWVVAGTGVVIVSGIYILHQEFVSKGEIDTG